jgi:polysaccharide chain length determinant protein (PEP-CTERM system associated)
MDDTFRQASSVLMAMWQRRWVGMAVAWALAFLGAGVVYVMRDRYEASARVFVDTQTVLKPLMNGLAFQPDVDQQVRMLARTLISRPNVERLIQSPRIGLQYLSEAEREKTIDRFTKEIKIAPSGDANLFAITYRDIDPQRAQRVVEDLVALFVSSGIVDKQRDSEQARQFLDDQIKSYETKLSESENRLKDFKIKNFGLTGTSNQDYFARMSASSDEVSRLRVELQAAEQAREALRKELSNEDPTMPAEASGLPTQSPTAEIDARLDSHKRQLDELMRRYTDEHPDVVAVRRSITQLEQQRRADLDAKAKASNGKLRPAPTSPVFQKIRVTLAEAEAKVASLRGQLGAQQSQLGQARTMAGRMPAVEAELAQLNRDYEVVRKNYEQLVSRRESASLGEKIDQTTKVAAFRVVEPPRVMPTPAKPSRMLVALACIAAALLGGAAATFGLSQALPSVYDTRQLKEVCGRPVLGSVSLALSPAIDERDRRNNSLFAGAMVIFLMVNVAWLVIVKQQMLP